MLYRKASLSDSRAVHKLICDMVKRELSYEKFYDIMNEQLQDRQHYYCLVAEEDDRIVGVLNMRIERQLRYAGPVAQIMEFAVDAEYRAKGIEEELIEKGRSIAGDFKALFLESQSPALKIQDKNTWK